MGQAVFIQAKSNKLSDAEFYFAVENIHEYNKIFGQPTVMGFHLGKITHPDHKPVKHKVGFFLNDKDKSGLHRRIPSLAKIEPKSKLIVGEFNAPFVKGGDVIVVLDVYRLEHRIDISLR